MDTVEENFLSEYILEKQLTNILDFNKDQICVLGLEFPIFKNKFGTMTIKQIKLDANISSKLTYQLGSLDFLNSTLHNYNEQIEIVMLRKKTVRLLIGTLSKLKNSKNLQEIVFLLTKVEQERKSIKHDVFNILM